MAKMTVRIGFRLPWWALPYMRLRLILDRTGLVAADPEAIAEAIVSRARFVTEPVE